MQNLTKLIKDQREEFKKMYGDDFEGGFRDKLQSHNDQSTKAILEKVIEMVDEIIKGMDKRTHQRIEEDPDDLESYISVQCGFNAGLSEFKQQLQDTINEL